MNGFVLYCMYERWFIETIFLNHVLEHETECSMKLQFHQIRVNEAPAIEVDYLLIDCS